MKGKTGRAAGALALGGMLLAVSPAAISQQGGYAGASIGQAEISGFCDDVRDVVTPLGFTTGACDEKDTAFKVYGGYRINPNFAIEGTYIDFGEARSEIALGGVPGTLDGSASGFGGAVLGIVPVAGSFSLFGKIGVLVTDAEVTINGPAGVVSESDTETGLHLGAGALFAIGEKFSLRAEWEHEDENEIDLISIGGMFRF